MLKEEEIREILLDAGCSQNEIETILGCISSGNEEKAEQMIHACRKKKLAEIHEKEICIDHLDYLVFQMKQAE